MTSFAFILGVVPLVIASGAGAEMRRSLGTAVFSGMLGVTLFGIFLTPVFFYVIQGLGETRLFAAAATRWVGSALLGGLLGPGNRLLAGAARRRAPALGAAGRRRRRASWSCWPSSAFIGRSGRRSPARRQARSHDPMHRAEIDSRDLAFLHRPADLRHGHLGRHRAGGRRGRVHAAGGAVSRGDAAHGAGDGALPRGQRPDRARHRGRADRGAGQRRRGHDVHVVAVHQRRRLQPDRDLQAGHGLRHGPGAGAEPRLAGPAGHPAAGAERGHQRQEDVARTR